MDAPRPLKKPQGSVVIAMLSLLLLVNLAASLYQLPLNLVVEKRLCLDYYLEHDPSQIGAGGIIDEALCKIDPVQKGLGWIQGMMDTIWVVGGIQCTDIPSLMLDIWHVLISCRLCHDNPHGLRSR